MPDDTELLTFSSTIRTRFGSLQQSRALLVALSGIDGSGKGYIARKLEVMLRARGLKVANIGIDPWQNLPNIRISDSNSGPHFYHNAMRFEALFRDLLLPLKQDRNVKITMDYMEQTASQFSPFTYEHSDIDIILVEGIFLFQPSWFHEFDMSIWVDCLETTALKRAIARNQEGVSEEALVAEYHQIYFPAQHYHRHQDNPTQLAEFLFNNDSEF